MEKSRTKQALDLLQANPGMSQYRACKLVGLSQCVLSRALAEQRQKALRQHFKEQGGYFVPN
jgi:predicted transcriptional regulator